MERDNYPENLLLLSQRRKRIGQKLVQALRMYSWIGAFMAIAFGSYFIATLLPIELTTKQLMLLIVSGVGVVLAFTSRTLMTFWREKERAEIERVSELESLTHFLNAWFQFERTGKEALGKQSEDFNRYSLRSLISHLQMTHKLDQSDVLLLEEALNIRNLVVHRGSSVPPEIVKRLVDSLERITGKLSQPVRER